MQFVKATIDDLPLLNAFLYESKAYWGYPPDFMEEFMHSFQVKESDIQTADTCLVYENDTALGFFTLRYGVEAELLNLFLTPQAIGRGLGKLVFAAVVKRFKGQGVKAFKIWSDPHAEGFYEKMGAHFVHEFLSPIGHNRMTKVYEYRI